MLVRAVALIATGLFLVIAAIVAAILASNVGSSGTVYLTVGWAACLGAYILFRGVAILQALKRRR